MSELTIKTNYHHYPILNWGDLTRKEKNEFDYLKTDEERWACSFVRYNEWVYDLGDLERAPDSLKEWDMIHGDSYFSGVLFKYVDEYESVICATYFS